MWVKPFWVLHPTLSCISDSVNSTYTPWSRDQLSLDEIAAIAVKSLSNGIVCYAGIDNWCRYSMAHCKSCASLSVGPESSQYLFPAEGCVVEKIRPLKTMARSIFHYHNLTKGKENLWSEQRVKSMAGVHIWVSGILERPKREMNLHAHFV